MSFTVLATPRSFAKNDDAPIRLLEEQGCTVIRLPMNGGDLQAQLLEQLPQADAVIAGLEPYTRSMLETAKNLKIISRYGVGYDKVDLEAAHAMGIKVSITPGANSDSVADLAMTLMLAAARNVCPMDAAIRAGGHDKPITGVEMWNKTLGVVGTGRIGKGVIQRASGFQMKVLAPIPPLWRPTTANMWILTPCSASLTLSPSTPPLQRRPGTWWTPAVWRR